MTTAGHCFGVGEKIYASNVAGQGATEGTVTYRNYPSYEAELISGGTYAPAFYAGAAGDNYANKYVIGRSSDIVGTSGICRTGWKSGNSCGWTLTTNDGEFCYQGACTEYLNGYQGGTSPQPGDSGGPIYYLYNGGAILSGTIVGSSCNIFGCVYWGEKIGTILGYWSLTLVCSGTCILQ